jgi:hypothetical protein
LKPYLRNEGAFDFQLVQQRASNKLDRGFAVCHTRYGKGFMKTRTFLLCFAVASIATSYADSDKSVTAAQVNGTWKTKYGEFTIWALGKHRLQVEFSGVYEYKTPQGPMAN